MGHHLRNAWWLGGTREQDASGFVARRPRSLVRALREGGEVNMAREFKKGDRVRRTHEMGNRAFVVIAVARKKFHQSIDRFDDFNNLGKQIIKVRTVLSNGQLGETWGWENAGHYELWTPQKDAR